MSSLDVLLVLELQVHIFDCSPGMVTWRSHRHLQLTMSWVEGWFPCPTCLPLRPQFSLNGPRCLSKNLSLGPGFLPVSILSQPSTHLPKISLSLCCQLTPSPDPRGPPPAAWHSPLPSWDPKCNPYNWWRHACTYPSLIILYLCVKTHPLSSLAN